MDPELLIPILGTVGIDIEAFELPEFWRVSRAEQNCFICWHISTGSRRHRPSHNSAHASTHCRYAAATERHGHQSGPRVSRTRFNCHYAEVYAYSKGPLNRRVEKTASFTVTAGASLITIRHCQRSICRSIRRGGCSVSSNCPHSSSE
jgi:hypothetical protein